MIRWNHYRSSVEITLASKGKVLAVDDEDGITEYVQYMLQNAGFEVTTASGGWEAWDLITADNFDFVISDVRMDKGDGVELLEKIREMTPPKPRVALMSAYTDISLSDVYERGAVALIQKPTRSELLTAIVEHAILPAEKRWTVNTSSDQNTGNEILRRQFPSFTEALSSGELLFGQGGLFLGCTGPFPLVDTVVKFEITFTSGTPSVLTGTGIVRWGRAKAPRMFHAGLGLEFLHLDQATFTFVSEYLQKTNPEAYIPVGQIPPGQR